MSEKNALKLAVSINCLDSMHLGDALNNLHDHEVAELLFPVGDGDVAPFMSGLDMMRQVSAQTSIPCHILLLARHPERHIDACAKAGSTTMTISLEASNHQHRILSGIRDAGMKAGIAINPATSLIALDYLLEKADRVCLLGVEPGGGGSETANATILDRVKLLAENIRYRELLTGIMVYGGVNAAMVGRVLAAGASMIGIEPEMLLEAGELDMPDVIRKYTAMLRAL